MAPVNGARGQVSAPEPLRVAIVEDDVTTRDGLAALIEGTPGYRCVGRYGSVEELLRKPLDRAANVVLLDINLPDGTGWDFADWMDSFVKSVPIIVMSGITRPSMKQLERAGVKAFLAKPFPIQALLDLVKHYAAA